MSAQEQVIAHNTPHSVIPRIFTKADVRIGERFAEAIVKKYPDQIKAVVLDRRPVPSHELDLKKRQIPLMVIIDDVTVPIKDQAVTSYLRDVAHYVHDVSRRLHVSTKRLSEHWDQSRNRFPDHLQIIRYGLALYDKGFFEPMQLLLAQGRVRPSFESENVYVTRANATLKNATGHMLQAVLDLYWACIDACHAGLMIHGELPCPPHLIGKRMHEVLVSKGLLEADYRLIMDRLYAVSRGIMHKQVRTMTGAEYAGYLKDAQKLVKRMEGLVIPKLSHR